MPETALASAVSVRLVYDDGAGGRGHRQRDRWSRARAHRVERTRDRVEVCSVERSGHRYSIGDDDVDRYVVKRGCTRDRIERPHQVLAVGGYAMRSRRMETPGMTDRPTNPDAPVPVPTPVETIELDVSARERVVGYRHGTKTYCEAHHEQLGTDGDPVTLGDLHDSDDTERYCSACVTECNAMNWPKSYALIYQQGVTERRAF